MMKFDSPEEEVAYREMKAAEAAYSQAQRNVVARENELPGEEYRTPEEAAAFLILRKRTSNAWHERKRAKDAYALAKAGRGAGLKLERIKELLEDVKPPSHLDKIREQLNPEGRPIEEVYGYNKIIEGMKMYEAKKLQQQTDLDILKDGLAGSITPLEEEE